jgi:hypothetical protein
MPVHNQRWFGQCVKKSLAVWLSYLWGKLVHVHYNLDFEQVTMKWECAWRQLAIVAVMCIMSRFDFFLLLLFFLPPIVACSTTNGKTLGVQLLTWQTIASLLLQLSSDFLQSGDNNLTPSMLVLQVIFGKIFVSHNNKIVMSIHCTSMLTYGWEGWGGGNCSIYSVVIS